MSVKRTGIIDASLRVKINELMTFALTTPTEKADVFIEFAAHCNAISVLTYFGGWESDADADFSSWIDLPRSDDPEHTTVEYAIEAIDSAIREIKEALL